MSATTLTVPVPQFVLDPPSGPPALEKPVTVRIPHVRFPDSSLLTTAEALTVGIFVFRLAGGSQQVWDEGDQVWRSIAVSADSLSSLQPIPLLKADAEDGTPWSGMLVAAGQKDASGGNRFGVAAGGTPCYHVRGFATAKRGDVVYLGLSGASSDLLFVSMAEQQRYVIELDPEEPASATTVRMVLRNGSLAPAGFIEITTAGGQSVDIANCTTSGSVLARIRLTDAGDIRLQPASGRSVIIDGPLEAQEVSYQPSGGGGSRATL